MTASIQRDYYGSIAIYQRVLNCLIYKIRGGFYILPLSCMKLGKILGVGMIS